MSFESIIIIILLWVFIAILVFFLAGFSENSLENKCTVCNKDSKVTAMCWMYEGLAVAIGSKPRKFKFGRAHSHFLCDSCQKKVWERIGK